MKTILVIENDADTLEMIGYLFEDAGFKVVQSKGKLSVVEIININPNLVLVDYHLSNGNGADLCSAIKANPLSKHLPVILVSASIYIDRIFADSCADAFVTKPFDINQLEKLVMETAL